MRRSSPSEAPIKPAKPADDGAHGLSAADELDALDGFYEADDCASPMAYDDDQPGWSFERDVQGLNIGLLDSRPIQVYRHTEHPQFKAAIGEVIERLFVRELENAGSLSDKGLGANRVSSRRSGVVGGGDGYVESSSQLPTSLPNDLKPVLCKLLGYGSGNTASESYRQLRNHLRIVLLDAYISHHEAPSQWVGYARNDKKFDGLKSRYNRLRLSRQFLTQAIDLLTKQGYLENWIPAKGKRGMQSRFRPTAKLVECMVVIPVQAITINNSVRESIVLMGEKDPKTKLAPKIKYRDDDHGDKPKQWRENLETINKHLASAKLGVSLDAATIERERIDFTRNQLHRVFNNNDWSQGGRFYGAWWIKLHNRAPHHYRRSITIDGEPTVEVDYSQIHPTMLYVQAGLRVVERKGVRVALPGLGLAVPTDSYTVPGLEREDAKTVFNTMLNVRSPQGIYQAVKNAAKDDAIKAIKQDARSQGKKFENFDKDEIARLIHQQQVTYTACINPIRAAHKAIAGAFGSGIGLVLQGRDAAMAEAVMLQLVQREVTVLPVHDSFIVKAECEGLLISIMDTVLHDFFPELSCLSDGLNFKVTEADGRKRVLRSGVVRTTHNH